ncbi:hypothetical protein B0H10DRAFT_2442145, partial [Mycena sp. CBHHK59/15]
MMASSRSHSPSTSSELDGLGQHTNYLKEKRQAEMCAQRQQQERHERQAQRNTLESKRSQWKAASARYYENHPEVREKKRLKMAEQRAAKKLARRRWDPPKKPKRNTSQRDEQLEDFTANISLDLNPDDP